MPKNKHLEVDPKYVKGKAHASLQKRTNHDAPLYSQQLGIHVLTTIWKWTEFFKGVLMFKPLPSSSLPSSLTVRNEDFSQSRFVTMWGMRPCVVVPCLALREQAF